jgi:transposase
VEGVKLDKERLEIEVDVSMKETAWLCPECGERMHIHGYQARRWRHLDSCQFKTIIRCDVPRVKCREHGTQVVQVPWAGKGSRFTLLFERLAIDLLRECSISAAGDLLRITWEEADGIKQRAVRRGLARKPKTPCRHLGLDEKSFRRGHDYVTVVTSKSGEGTIVEHVADSRRREDMDKYWQSLTGEQLESVKSVSMDMWEPFVSSTLANVPAAQDKIVFDRFHIMKHMNEAVNAVRRQEQKLLRKEKDTTLDGTRQIWLYAEENLPKRYKERLNELKETELKTARAWMLKELVRYLWDYGSVSEGRYFFRQWYKWAIHSGLEPVKKVARMIKDRLRNILTYFNPSTTNANAEGINNKIQSLINKAYGYRNKERFKTDILFHCGGLDLYPGTA